MAILEKTELSSQCRRSQGPGDRERPSRRSLILGVGKYQPHGNKAAPPIRTAADYPENGDKRVADLETALRKCGLRDGMVISSHHHLRDGDRVALDGA